MRNFINASMIMMTMIALAPAVKAEYKETMNPDGLTKNLKMDFGLVDDKIAYHYSFFTVT